jgi:transcriptional antiterminator RfaH
MEYSPMPLLSAEPSFFPDTLFSGDGSCPEAVPDWLVIYTRARAEKALARKLLARRVGFFLPLHERRWPGPTGRMRCSYLPLFPGYVFLHGATEARGHALETGLVSRCLSVVDQVGLHRDLARIYRLISSGAPLLPEERLEPGSPVEIVLGSLAGLHGKVIRRGKQLRLVVEVELLQRGVSVEIDSHMVQAIRKPPDPGLCYAKVGQASQPDLDSPRSMKAGSQPGKADLQFGFKVRPGTPGKKNRETTVAFPDGNSVRGEGEESEAPADCLVLTSPPGSEIQATSPTS